MIIASKGISTKKVKMIKDWKIARKKEDDIKNQKKIFYLYFKTQVILKEA